MPLGRTYALLASISIPPCCEMDNLCFALSFFLDIYLVYSYMFSLLSKRFLHKVYPPNGRLSFCMSYALLLLFLCLLLVIVILISSNRTIALFVVNSNGHGFFLFFITLVHIKRQYIYLGGSEALHAYVHLWGKMRTCRTKIVWLSPFFPKKTKERGILQYTQFPQFLTEACQATSRVGDIIKLWCFNAILQIIPGLHNPPDEPICMRCRTPDLDLPIKLDHS